MVTSHKQEISVKGNPSLSSFLLSTLHPGQLGWYRALFSNGSDAPAPPPPPPPPLSSTHADFAYHPLLLVAL